MHIKPIPLLIVIAVAGAIAYWALLRNTGTAPSAGTDGGPMVEITVPDLSLNARKGKQAFEANCIACHGANAAGRDGSGPPLVHKTYEPGHHGDAAFILAARRGVQSHHWRFGNMPPVENVSDEALVQIVAYVRELQRANGIN